MRSETTFVTLRIERKESGTVEVFNVEARTQWVVPLIFRAVNGALGAHASEFAQLKAAATMLADFVRAAYEPEPAGESK